MTEPDGTDRSDHIEPPDSVPPVSAEHDEHEAEIEERHRRHGEGEVPAGDQDAAVEDGLALAEHAVGEPAAGHAHQVDHRGVGAVDRAGGRDVEAETAIGHRRGHEQDEEPAHPEVREALPHLAEEERRETAGVPEKCAVGRLGAQAAFHVYCAHGASSVQPSGTNPGGSAAPSPKKNSSMCFAMRSWDSFWKGSRRYSLRIIFIRSSHISHASAETCS